MKKLFTLLIAMLLVTTVVLGSGVLADASGNTGDTYFQYTLPQMGTINIYNPGRAKLNATGTYVYLQSGPASGVRFSVWGGYASSWQNTTLLNFTGGGGADIWVTQQRRISQYVYENGRTYAFLGITPRVQGDVGSALSGLWSPDSQGSWPYANPGQ